MSLVLPGWGSKFVPFRNLDLGLSATATILRSGGLEMGDLKALVTDRSSRREGVLRVLRDALAHEGLESVCIVRYGADRKGTYWVSRDAETLAMLGALHRAIAYVSEMDQMVPEVMEPRDPEAS